MTPGAAGEAGAGAREAAGDGGANSSAGASANSSAGADSSAGANGEAGSGSVAAAPLPLGTFLYVRSVTADHDSLIARDFETGAERVVTDLTGDGSDGWEIWGHTLSPDRQRIVLSSLFGPTKADNATGIATRRLWSLATDGSDFRRLTPVFPNTGAGRTNFEISVDSPAFTADGSGVLYDFGNWWWEGTTLQGGSFPWLAPLNGDLPKSFPTIASCSVINPAVNPATGEVLFIHSVCVSSADEGLFLYPKKGGTNPTLLVPRLTGSGHVDPSLETASWAGDGSGFVFVGDVDVSSGRASALLAYDMASGDLSALVVAEAGTRVQSATLSADATRLVYCLAHDGVYDLHAIDLTLNKPVDEPITSDGKSCDPAF